MCVCEMETQAQTERPAARELLVCYGNAPCEATCPCGQTLRPGAGLVVTHDELVMHCPVCGEQKRVDRVDYIA